MSGLLFDKVPDAYMSVKNSSINTEFFGNQKNFKFKEKRSTSSRVCIFKDKNGEFKIGSTIFQIQDIRIINIGKYHVDFQIESKTTNEFGMLRSAKIYSNKRGKYFKWKNNKYFLSKRHIVL